MIRITNIIVFVIVSMSVFGLFKIKYKVQHLKEDLAALTKQAKQEKEALHVLKAEWAYLNHPNRINRLATRHLKLESIKLSQIVKMENDLPVQLAEIVNNNELEEAFSLAENEEVNDFFSQEQPISTKQLASDVSNSSQAKWELKESKKNSYQPALVVAKAKY